MKKCGPFKFTKRFASLTGITPELCFALILSQWKPYFRNFEKAKNFSLKIKKYTMKIE